MTSTLLLRGEPTSIYTGVGSETSDLQKPTVNGFRERTGDEP